LVAVKLPVAALATPAPPKGNGPICTGEGKRVKHIMAMNRSENAIEAGRDQCLTFNIGISLLSPDFPNRENAILLSRHP
jgi:hypothetical protein